MENVGTIIKFTFNNSPLEKFWQHECVLTQKYVFSNKQMHALFAVKSYENLYIDDAFW